MSRRVSEGRFSEVGGDVQKPEGRRPKPERRPKAGIRIVWACQRRRGWGFRSGHIWQGLGAILRFEPGQPCFRASAFGFLSAFGLRVSDFRRRLVSLCTALAFAAAAAGCRRDMFQQPSSKPLGSSDFFRDQMASRPLVAHTVARGHLEADEAFYRGKIGTNLVETFPVAITRETLERGQERFEIYCAPCHGRTGDGNGMIVLRGYPAPPSYHLDRLRQAPAGHFFDVMTHGYGVMYSYAQRVTPSDRWAIAAYVRVLQQSHNATLSEVPPDQRAALERANPR
jgi:mono/diheme cytochrome c family protein